MTDRTAIEFSILRSNALSKPERSEEWLAKVRMLPCCGCAKTGPSDPHHVFGSVHGLKSTDLYTVPLCRQCHERAESHADFRHSLIYTLPETMRQVAWSVMKESREEWR